jgi:hypothetical protein
MKWAALRAQVVDLKLELTDSLSSLQLFFKSFILNEKIMQLKKTLEYIFVRLESLILE